MCLNAYIETSCNCTDPLRLEAFFLADVEPENNVLCSIVKDSEQRKCANEAGHEFQKHRKKLCPCKPECQKIDYEVSFFYKFKLYFNPDSNFSAKYVSE